MESNNDVEIIEEVEVIEQGQESKTGEVPEESQVKFDQDNWSNLQLDENTIWVQIEIFFKIEDSQGVHQDKCLQAIDGA